MKSFLHRRVLAPLRYSFAGLRQAWRTEEAFRVEVIISALLLPWVWVVGNTGAERALLLLSLGLVLMVEILNTAVEKAIDRISVEHHALSKVVKDLGSAAVLVSIVWCVGVWVVIALS